MVMYICRRGSLSTHPTASPSPVKILIMKKSTVHLMLSEKYTEVKEQLISLIVILYAIK